MIRRRSPPPKSEGQIIYEIKASEDSGNAHYPEWRDLPPEQQQFWETYLARLQPIPARKQEGDADNLG